MNLTKYRFEDFCIYFSLFILGFNFIAFSAFTQEDSDGGIVKLLLRLVVVGLLFLCILIKKKITLFYLMILPLILIFYLINTNVFALNILYIVLFVCALQGYEKDKLLKNIFLIYIFMVCYHLVFLKFGFISNVYSEYAGRYRANYGFGNFNKLGMLYFYFGLICLYYLFNKSKIYFKVLSLVGLILSIFFIIASNSRTSLITFSIIFLIYFFNKFNFISRIFLYSFKYALIFCFLLTLILSSSFGLYFNDILSTRPELFNRYTLELFDMPYLLFGYFGEPNYPVDNSYLVLMGTMGPLIMVTFIFLSPFIFKKHSIIISQIPILLGLMVFGIFENSLLRVELLLPILLFYCLMPNINRV